MVLYKCGEIQVQFFDSVVLQLNKFNYMVIAGKKNTILYWIQLGKLRHSTLGTVPKIYPCLYIYIYSQ